ncbi:DUF2924 domain-containing protein [Sphingomonas profundi]|uniref:DUF2924 domain-containing protein n=1 Tax=Alterirhizorhabdus profundi TaxID=2681549 RepID=UPI0012E75F32|nr:DUF2924 domain-containing protein [Sphingomonas profundi]
MARLDDQLRGLATLSPAELRRRWQDMFGEEAPDLSISLIRRTIGYRLQEQAHGGLPPTAERMLAALARDPGTEPMEMEIRLKPGTRLVREWNGTVHDVLVTDDGLLFDDHRYSSLSHVARAITGARWSGPRFFGLKRPTMPPRQGVAHG